MDDAMHTVVGDDPGRVVIPIATAEDMRTLGRRMALATRGGDVLLLSGPLGAGKTTFAQGFGQGLGIKARIVSPTFTIARELDGRFADGSHAHLVHVDAYRLGGHDFAPGQNTIDALLDELESLGLDEELEDPHDDTVVLMEWGEQMAAALAEERLEIHIDRPAPDMMSVHGYGSHLSSGDDQDMDEGDKVDGDAHEVPNVMTEDGERLVTINPVGVRWRGRRLPGLQGA